MHTSNFLERNACKNEEMCICQKSTKILKNIILLQHFLDFNCENNIYFFTIALSPVVGKLLKMMASVCIVWWYHRRTPFSRESKLWNLLNWDNVRFGNVFMKSICIFIFVYALVSYYLIKGACGYIVFDLCGFLFCFVNYKVYAKKWMEDI